MKSLFDEEEILKSYIRSEVYDAAQEKAKNTAIKMLKAGKFDLKEIAEFSDLSVEEVQKIENELMQFA